MKVRPGDRLCVCGHDFGKPASKSDLIQHFALHRHEVHEWPCPECAGRLSQLRAASAPVEGCNCRVCRWLRDNADYKGPRRG